VTTKWLAVFLFDLVRRDLIEPMGSLISPRAKSDWLEIASVFERSEK
jgi:hypothetical protein